MSLIFDKKEHKYYLDGLAVPSVTGLIKKAGLMPDYTDMKACEYGTKVHKAVAAISKGEKYETDAFIDIALQGFAQWESTFKPSTTYSEMGMGSRKYGYAGTIDLICKISGKYWLIDVKTGGSSPWHKIQLAGYGQLCKEEKIKIDKYAGLYLDPVESKFVFKEVKQSEILSGFSVFLNCINLHKWRTNNGI